MLISRLPGLTNGHKYLPEKCQALKESGCGVRERERKREGVASND